MVGEPWCFGLFFSCAEDLPLAVVLLFCSEGDNIPDALTLVNQLNDWLHLLDNPVSSRQEFTACAAKEPRKKIRHSGASLVEITSIFPLFSPPVREIFLVPFKYDLFQKRAPFSFSLIQILLALLPESPIDKT